MQFRVGDYVRHRWAWDRGVIGVVSFVSQVSDMVCVKWGAPGSQDRGSQEDQRHFAQFLVRVSPLEALAEAAE